MGDHSSTDPWLTVVGVAEEVNYSLWEEYQRPALYVSEAQQPQTEVTIAVITNGNPLVLASAARKAIASVDPGLPVDPVETYSTLVRDDMVGLIYAAVMLSIDAFVALLLSGIGIFGVMANLVGERRREIGVRLALGARKEDVVAMILRRASWLAGAGIVTGLALAFALAHLVANLLRGVSPNDPAIFATVTGVIAAVAFAASWLPARQASRVDPMQALRARITEVLWLSFTVSRTCSGALPSIGEIADEIQAHIDLRTESNVAAGMSPTEARREALLRFGNAVSTRERVTASDTTLSLAELWRDIRYSVRQLQRSPGFAATAILTLALGIGANVVVFGVLNALVLRPINVPSADRLFEIEHREHGNLSQSYPDYLDYRARNTAFSDMATYRMEDPGLSTGGSTQTSWIYEVSGNYFDLLGVQPALGRFFSLE